MSKIKVVCLMIISMFIGAVISYSMFLPKDVTDENAIIVSSEEATDAIVVSSEETTDVVDDVHDVDKQDETYKTGFVYPKTLTNNPTIIFVPNDEVLRSFPKKVVYGIYCALTEGLEMDASDFFVSTWEKDDYGTTYTVCIGFNSGASVNLQVNAISGAYRYDKTKEEIESNEHIREIRGEPIYTFTEAQIDKYASYVTDYTGIVNPELQSIKEYNCCDVVWYNDAGTDRFLRFSKNTHELEKRGHYDVIKEEYVVDWEKEEDTE